MMAIVVNGRFRPSCLEESLSWAAACKAGQAQATSQPKAFLGARGAGHTVLLLKR